MTDISAHEMLIPADLCVDGDDQLIEVTLLDPNASRGVLIVLDREGAQKLALRILEQVGAALETSATDRIDEARLLIKTIVCTGGRTATWIAGQIGVSDAVVSTWRNGIKAPSPQRIGQLRQLARAAVRAQWAH
jgi:hypothetical protein